jgi:ABC-2 type transport system ATP-binding protein
MENVLEIKDLRKDYEGFTLRDVSFSLPQGFIMGLIGPNGAGKTTIIKLILNVIKKSAGEIKVFGADSLENEVAVKSRIGFVHDTPFFYEYLSLKQLKATVAPFYKNWDDDLFHRLISEFDLPLSKAFSKLSRGMKMKFALALALSHRADFIILDEPTSGLDPVFRRELLGRLSELIQDEGKSVLFSTHITSDLERIADFITFIDQGRIVFSSAKDEILGHWGVVKGPNELLSEDNKGFFKGFREREFGFEALCSNLSEARRRFGQKAVIEKASLEDIMFYMTRRGKDA